MTLLLCACQKAVRSPETVTYLIKGDKHSAIYPLDIVSSSEDVHIHLPPAAPDPQVWAMENNGNPVQFNFSREGDTLIVPGKFEHLQLRHAPDGAIDISKIEK